MEADLVALLVNHQDLYLQQSISHGIALQSQARKAHHHLQFQSTTRVPTAVLMLDVPLGPRSNTVRRSFSAVGP